MDWILDDGPFNDLSDFATADSLARSTIGRFLVTDATANASSDSPLREKLLTTSRIDNSRLVDVISISINADDPAAKILLELHGEERTTTNLAEREAIAWSLAHSNDSVFVTVDRRAATTALAELGRGRVAHPFDLWIELRACGALTRQQFEGICERTRGKDQGLTRMPARVVRVLEID